VAECVFAPYFSTDQGAARFAAIHKVFGASNAAKLLAHLPAADRCEAVVTITYEAQSRLRDPVYGCVAQIFALQQQVTSSLLLPSSAIDQLATSAVPPAMDALTDFLFTTGGDSAGAADAGQGAAGVRRAEHHLAGGPPPAVAGQQQHRGHAQAAGR
jgi:hypothetical protein